MSQTTTGAHAQTAAWYSAIISALPQDMTARSIELLTRRQQLLKAILRTALLSPVARLETRWQLSLGNQANKSSLLEQLRSAGFRITRWAEQMTQPDKFIPVKGQIEAELVLISMSDLGLKTGGTYFEVCTRGEALGLQLCPAEVGPLLRLIYRDQNQGERFCVAMTPLNVAGRELIFKIERNGNSLWLNWEAGDVKSRPIMTLAEVDASH